MRSAWVVALATAMALGTGLTPPPAIAAGVDSPSVDTSSADVPAAAATVDFSAFLEPTATELPPADPQPAGEFSFIAVNETESGPPRAVAASAVYAMSRPAELSDSPMAPLPPAVVAGPIGIAFAAIIAWRAKRRGGRI
jgi:hypothetical protein